MLESSAPVAMEQLKLIALDEEDLAVVSSLLQDAVLRVRFEPAETPGGYVTLTFSGDASIQLKVECIEAELRDLGPEWRTRCKPEHPGDEPGAGSEPGASGSSPPRH